MAAGCDEPFEELLDAARAAWPGVDLPAPLFSAHLARHAPQGASGGALHLGDLYIACACAHGRPGAVEALERRHGAELHAHLARMGLPPAAADEVRQILRERLFVAAAGALPRIAEYGGRGPLSAWLRTAAQRAALNQLRGRRDLPLDDEAGPASADAGEDAERAFLKGHYQGAFQDAFRDALELLDPRGRDVLQLYYLDDHTVEQIAALRRVHPSTAARWVIAARQALTTHMQNLLRARLRLAPRDFHSLAALMRSRIDVAAALGRGQG